MDELTAEDLMYGYMNGIFPMADTDGSLYWYSPDPRAIIPIDTYKPAKSLRPILNKNLFDIHINRDFEAVMRHCALPRNGEPETWISEEIIQAYCDLHQMGMAHSVEAYVGDRLVGGLYGVAIGGVYFGESMFYLEPNSSKVAFHYLIENLRKQQYELLDTQFINDNVKRYGAIEIPREDYLILLRKAIQQPRSFVPDTPSIYFDPNQEEGL
ncbi:MULTISPECIES: leucyl/phenylalanyl-tRNA--protein transferase [Flectobacillus]|uniref:leucyl/phenylalanyl-tRNA--protein transferase n=1 Tax=Flectobacillus TaxID=101 RepID=UPI000BA480BE|nr:MULTISPECIES: leucyl/phenylalanyl-tRNA--protein transferase [Flectobacillus]MDI9870970.1 leucyl/phenylalanyl-tRNA--protein transferase [Flectobacillus roseus]PAC31741.1 leucyl/phenylalanyl-tRNA--protein transferase [Flectobacillus sp. BAB-3569]